MQGRRSADWSLDVKVWCQRLYSVHVRCGAGLPKDMANEENHGAAASGATASRQAGPEKPTTRGVFMLAVMIVVVLGLLAEHCIVYQASIYPV